MNLCILVIALILGDFAKNEDDKMPNINFPKQSKSLGEKQKQMQRFKDRSSNCESF